MNSLALYLLQGELDKEYFDHLELDKVSKSIFATFEVKGSTCFYTICNNNKRVTRFVKYSKLTDAPDVVYKSELESMRDFGLRVKAIAKG